MNGLADGNDGPFTDEGAFMAPDGEPAMETGSLDADIIWVFDLKTGAGMYPHDSTHASIMILGDHLYLNSCNGVDNTHKVIRKPDAPGIVVLDKRTGRLLARDRENTAPDTFHSNWSSPALGEAGGQKLIYYAAGNGILFGMSPIDQATDEVQTLDVVWRCDLDPAAPKEDIHSYLRNRNESPSNVKSMPVSFKDRVYVTLGGDIWWGKREAWLKCYSASGTGDISESGLLWSYPLREHTCSTPAISDGLAYAADCDGWLHCVDAETGQEIWTHDCEGEIWASPMVADGQVYIGTRRGDFWILAAGRDKNVKARYDMGAPISATLVPTNGTLYLATQSDMFAIR
jgi:outer membrane protein assembly factor BamB